MALSALEKFQLSDLPDRNECTQGSARVKYPPPSRAVGRHIQRDATIFSPYGLYIRGRSFQLYYIPRYLLALRSGASRAAMSISWDDNLTQYLKYSYAYHRRLSHMPYA